MEIREGGVTSAKGFRAASVCAGFKKGRKDMSMIVSEVPFHLAGTFTTNLVKAAPVIWDRAIVQTKGTAQAVVMNSGIPLPDLGFRRSRFFSPRPASSASLSRWTRSDRA